jgi:hypothetical protein
MHKRFGLERYKEKDSLENLGVDTKSAGVWLKMKTSSGFL